MTQRRIPCIGLTGGIGSGKSTVAELFRELGAHVIDTDAISHELTREQGLAIPAIRATFGPEYITASGALDRARMRGLIIEDPQAKARLERILHPIILDEAKKKMLEPAPYCMLMAPLLFESPDFLKLVDRVLLIDCTEQNQIDRVMQRSSLSKTEIRALIALQLPREERKNRADDIMQNDGALSDLKARVASLHLSYQNLINNHLTAG